jgi:hypothetical protein
MAQVVHDVLRAAIECERRPYWWQCCVLIEPFGKQDYLKTDTLVRSKLKEHRAAPKHESSCGADPLNWPTGERKC